MLLLFMGGAGFQWRFFSLAFTREMSPCASNTMLHTWADVLCPDLPFLTAAKEFSGSIFLPGDSSMATILVDGET